MSPKIITLTMNAAIDKSSTVEQVRPEDKLRCTLPRFDPGGGGINVARVIHRLGGDVQAVYPAGGAIGQMLNGLLDEEGIAHTSIEVSAQTRTNFTVFEEVSGQQYRFGMPGAPLQPYEWQKCLDFLAQSNSKTDYVVASGSLPLDMPTDFYTEVARVCKQIGARFILDTSGDALKHGTSEGTYLLKPNMRELSLLFEGAIEKEEDQVVAAQSLIKNNQAEIVVVSLGAAGALLVTKDLCKRLRSPIVPIRSKVGAGDSMMGGILTALSQDWPIEQAVQYGIAAGSAAVMSPGTMLCQYDDVQRLYQEITA